jgi:hypothetical protein
MEKLAPTLAAHSGVDVVEVAYASAVRSVFSSTNYY